MKSATWRSSPYFNTKGCPERAAELFIPATTSCNSLKTRRNGQAKRACPAKDLRTLRVRQPTTRPKSSCHVTAECAWDTEKKTRTTRAAEGRKGRSRNRQTAPPAYVPRGTPIPLRTVVRPDTYHLCPRPWTWLHPWENQQKWTS